MKCRFLYPNKIVEEGNPLNGQSVPAGFILERHDCFWLCNLHRSFLRPLNTLKGEETFELVTMDGSEASLPVKFTAEPADQECLDECIRRGWMKPGTTLAADLPTEPSPVVEVPPPIAEPVPATDTGVVT